MRESARALQTRWKARAAFLARDVVNAGFHVARDLVFLRNGPPNAPRSVVVHLVGNIGDIVVAIPALIALRERYPEARITLLTSAGHKLLPGARDVLDGARFLDDILEYTTDDIRARRGLARVLKAARALRPDLLVMVPPSMAHVRTLARNLTFARLIGAKYAVGVEVATFPAFLKEQAHARAMHTHEVERCLALLRPLGIQPTVRFELPPPPPSERARVDAIRRDGPFVTICPGGKQLGHLWPADRFGAVAARLSSQQQRVVTIGAASDREVCSRVLAQAGGGTDVSGQLSVLGTAELLRHASLLLSNDTGPMHLAAAVGTPVVAVFSSWDFAGRWYPYGSGNTVFRARQVCDTCLFAATRTDHCVRTIQVDEVCKGCLETLERKRSVSAPARVG